jgi:hypothetical protein
MGREADWSVGLHGYLAHASILLGPSGRPHLTAVAAVFAALGLLGCGPVPTAVAPGASTARTASPVAPSNAPCPSQSRPSARSYSAMVYMESSREFLLFGGLSATGYLNDTWTWRSGCWTRHALQTSPLGRAHAAVAYDRKHSVVVLTGGDAIGSGGAAVSFPEDTWLWNGSTWMQGAASPPMAMPLATFDDDTQSVILVGFNNRAAGSQSFNMAGAEAQIWTWDGSSWQKVSSIASGPAGRVQGSLAFDPVHHQVVLFGGYANRPQGDTWTWDGTKWSQAQQTTASPSPRLDPSMAFLRVVGAIVLIGGGRDDQWSWNGTAWSQMQPSHRPGVRAGTAMASDGQRLLLFGGADASDHNDLWAFDGNDWASA